MTYAAHDALTAPARARSDLWLTLVGLICTIVAYGSLTTGYFWLLDRILPTQKAQELFQGLSGDGNALSTLLFLASFIMMIAAVWIVVLVLHRRGFLSLLGNPARLWRDFLITAGIAIAFLAISTPVILLFVETQPQRTLGPWLALMVVALPLILLQTGAEELAFRGYLQQQLAARFSRPVFWMILPSVLFGLGHIDGATQGLNAPAFVLATALFGILAADLTARTGSLGAAWGLHFVNNVMAIGLITLPGPISGLALHHVTIAQSSPALLPLIAIDCLGLILIWAIAVRVLR